MALNNNEKEVRDAMLKAGEFLRSTWPGKKENEGKINVQKKADGSLVTNADFESNRIIEEVVSKVFPDYGFVSEEAEIPKDINDFDKVWLIDPLDGTRSFVEGKDDFSILIGLSVDCKPSFGLVYFPALELEGYAKVGEGALFDGKAIKVSENQKLVSKKAFRRNAPRYDVGIEWETMQDSGLALMNVARGELDCAVIKLVHHKEWDLLAPTCFILEAGGKVTDENGNEILFNQPSMKNEYYVASNGLVHDEVLSIIANHE